MGHIATCLPDGRILVVGGATGNPVAYASASAEGWGPAAWKPHHATPAACGVKWP